MLFTSVALADNVQDDVAVNYPGGVSLVAGSSSSSATVGYYVHASNANDGDSGCNLDGDSEVLTLTINTPYGITANPSSISFAACDQYKYVTFTAASGAVSGETSVAISSNTTGGGGYNLNPAKFNITVTQPTNTPPSLNLPGAISVEATGPDGAVVNYTVSATDTEDNPDPTPSCTPVSGSTFPLGSTTINCSVTDSGGLSATGSFSVVITDKTAPVLLLPTDITEEATGPSGAAVTYSASATDLVDGPVTVNCSSASGSVFALDTTTVSCSATDAAGNTANGSFKVTVQDTTPPVITFVSRTAANSNGWNNGDVTVNWSCSDAVGVKAENVSQTVSSEGANQSATGTCEDLYGHTASNIQTGINIDKTAPTASATATPGPNANGWNNTDVVISFSGTDTLSGIDTCSESVTLSSEGANQSASGTCTDKAGNESAAAFASASIDKTAPSVSLEGGPVDGGTYYFGFVPAAPTCSTSDLLSGLDGVCSVSGYSNALGIHTVTASATDKAGNSASASATYEVKAWTLSGFYAPVDKGIHNTVKAGATVPLKFEVFAGPTELTSITAVLSFTQTKVQCDGSLPEDAVEITSTGGTTLRYDTTGGQFIQNWQTPKLAGACYLVKMTTQDGSSLSALFKLK